jgi:hypothetical protein
MKFITNKVFFIMITLIFFTALTCSLDKDENLGKDKNLTLFAFLTTDSIFSVHLSKSVDYYSVDDFERAYDGFIIIEKNEERIDSFDYPFRYMWAERKNIQIEQNDQFKIIARDSTGKSVTGTAVIPKKAPITKIDTSRVTINVSGVQRKYLECKILFQDPPDEDNYYQLVVTMDEWEKNENSSFHSFQHLDFHKADSVFFIKDQSGSVLSGIDFRGTFSDFRINGLNYPLKISIPAFYFDNVADNQKKRINFMLLSLTSDYFNYFRCRVIADYNYDLPIIDPIKIYGNVEGGLGLVGGIAVTSDSLILKGANF